MFCFGAMGIDSNNPERQMILFVSIFLVTFVASSWYAGLGHGSKVVSAIENTVDVESLPEMIRIWLSRTDAKHEDGSPIEDLVLMRAVRGALVRL